MPGDRAPWPIRCGTLHVPTSGRAGGQIPGQAGHLPADWLASAHSLLQSLRPFEQRNLSMTEVPLNAIKGSGSSPDPARFTAAQDESLLERVRARDHKAMTALFDRYGRMVYSVALRVLKDPGHAEDVMQDVFFNLWENARTFVSGRGSLGAWLVVIARNRSIDALRRRKPSDSVDDVVLPAKTNLASEAERNTIIEKVRVVMGG